MRHGPTLRSKLGFENLQDWEAVTLPSFAKVDRPNRDAKAPARSSTFTGVDKIVSPLWFAAPPRFGGASKVELSQGFVAVGWNIDRPSVSQLSNILSDMDDDGPWDCMLLQEGLHYNTREDAAFSCTVLREHLLFTGVARGGCPGCSIVINQKHAGYANCVGISREALAATIGDDILLVSANLPHRGYTLSEYFQALRNVVNLVRLFPKRLTIISIDANAQIPQ